MGACQNKCIYLAGNRDLNKNEIGFKHPVERDLPFEELEIKTKDGVKLHGWFIKQRNPKYYPTMIFFHGIGGNIGLRLEFFEVMFIRCQVNIIGIDYRGYGHSEGKPSEEGIKADTEAILDFVANCEDIDQSKVFIKGHSFGGAVATYAAHICPFKLAGLVLVNTFVSFDQLAEEKTGMTCISKVILDNHWNSLEVMGFITCPLLMYSGLKDMLVPPNHTQKLYDSAVSTKFKHKVEFPLGRHGRLWTADDKKYFDEMNHFIWNCISTNDNLFGGNFTKDSVSTANQTKPKNSMESNASY